LPSRGLFSRFRRGWPNPFTPITPWLPCTLHRKPREIRNFTPPPPCSGYLSRCNLNPHDRRGAGGMRIMAAQAFFDWAALEDSPTEGTLRRCLEAIPDAALLQG